MQKEVVPVMDAYEPSATSSRTVKTSLRDTRGTDVGGRDELNGVP